ncbi:MAG: phenazine biosynthesis protein PhzF family [Eubacterium sp.]|nr:phenazine biosynthesis protein PhzF family [Eubacterium sp.]
MEKIYRLYQVDSFTGVKFTGNPAGVVTNADGLNEYSMQQIARELNNSETAFVFTSNSDEYDVHLRYFTPSREVPICGHATIAAHYVRAVENRIATSRVIQKTGAGILPVDIIRENNDYKIIMTQGKIEFGTVIVDQDREFLLSALGIKGNDLLCDCPIQIVSTGHSKVMIGVKNKSTLNNLSPNHQALSRLSKIINCNGYYVFTLDTKEEVLVNGRMFAPAIGINEDPVTGNANGPLGAYLIHHKLVDNDGLCFRFIAKQGEAMGRTGLINVEVDIFNDEPSVVRVSGKAVIVFQSELKL